MLWKSTLYNFASFFFFFLRRISCSHINYSIYICDSTVLMRNKQWKIPTKKQDKDKLYKQIQQKNNVKKERSQSKRNDEHHQLLQIKRATFSALQWYILATQFDLLRECIVNWTLQDLHKCVLTRLIRRRAGGKSSLSRSIQKGSISCYYKEGSRWWLEWLVCFSVFGCPSLTSGIIVLIVEATNKR